MNLREETKDSKTLFEGRIITLKHDTVILPDGNEAKREYVCHSGGVCVVPVTENREILLVRQFRYPYGEETLEIPAGKREQKDTDTLECGKRELKEELGVTADNFISLGTMYPTPAYTTEVIYMYAAWRLHYGENKLDKDEFLEGEKIHIDRLVDMIVSGEIKDAKTQACVLKVKYLIDKGIIK